MDGMHGRINLVKSVLLLVSNYFMQSIMILVSISKNLRELLGGSYERTLRDERKLALVSRDQCCQPFESWKENLKHTNEIRITT